MRHGFKGGKIPVIYRLIGKPVKETAHFFLIGGFDGPEPCLDISFESVLAVDFHRVEMGGFRQENLIRVQNFFLFRLFHQRRTVIGMRDFNQGLGAFPYGAPGQAGDPVFGDYHIDCFTNAELIGKILDRKQDIGLLFQVAARQAEYCHPTA